MSSGGLARSFYLAAWMAIGGLGFGVSQGCSGGGRGDPNGREVSGTVTYNGSPVQGASLTFSSPDASAFGQTDAEGKFKLTTVSGGNVSLGEYKVLIVKKEAPPASQAPFDPDQYVPPSVNVNPDAPPPEPKDLLPAKYKTVKDTPLTASVTADGKNEFEFPLSD